VEQPKTILGYKITKDLGRGFYGAAYVGEREDFERQSVLKISPVSFYAFFGKAPFKEETKLHARLARNAEHVVGIENAATELVEFADGTTLECHVTVLDYVEGNLLQDYIDGKVEASAATICQIALDLIRIRAEFEANQLNHNDLHAENLIVERLNTAGRRVDAVDPSIRVMAIDLGSVSDESKSTESRYGDAYSIALHVDKLLARLLTNPSLLEDRDFRVALALQGAMGTLQSQAQNVRRPDYVETAEQIREAFYRAAQAWRPWTASLQLRGFGDHYNAQTLASWNVPRLLVDPENRWLAEVSKPGPQIVTGMRGCGKTMLLRALDIHARAAVLNGETNADALQRIEGDQFLGLFVSAHRLLDLRQSTAKLESRLTRLFVAYSLQVARALMHLSDLSESIVLPGSHAKIAKVVAAYLNGAHGITASSSIEDLERRLEQLAVMTSSGKLSLEVSHDPSEVFTSLAEVARGCTTITANSTVFFLLDDVSTRYLELERIDELLSKLLFQSPTCAFKFTSEWQTIELGLKSPGRNHPARVDRDLAVFDLGADVYQTINGLGKKGAEFVSRILEQRARFHSPHPKIGPRELLGDVALEQIAREIATSTESSRDRKQAYRGLSCLANVCVGDLGDVIKLYEEILRRAAAGRGQVLVPIDKAVQSECFQNLSSRRIYDLDRRGGYFKRHALGFAEAAHDLLVRSGRQLTKSGEPARLRQYSSIYVRVESDNPEVVKAQIDQLRQLIDAAVFVYTGGSARTKTKDSNPTQQFKLSYRKICGLAASIGLADRDRFELSGDSLQRWLSTADRNILLENQTRQILGGAVEAADKTEDANADESSGSAEGADTAPIAATSSKARRATKASAEDVQALLFEEGAQIEVIERGQEVSAPTAASIDVKIDELKVESLRALGIESVLTGFGFEQRALKSNEILAAALSPVDVRAVRYELTGYAGAIQDAWRLGGHKLAELGYSEAVNGAYELPGLALIDVSGLSKPLMFTAIWRELQKKRRVVIYHMPAEVHYPLEADLAQLVAAEKTGDPILFLDSLSAILKGESGPYEEVELLSQEVDLSRSRALIAFASAKHERLFSLLDRREFDYVDVLVTQDGSAHARVANYAADFVCQNYQNARVTQLNRTPLGDLVKHLDQRYLELYGAGGANVEIGLTGSKLQAIASAVLASRRKVAQAWYLRPGKFDEGRFSRGVKEAHIYDIKVG
jgi:hypothetical protein